MPTTTLEDKKLVSKVTSRSKVLTKGFVVLDEHQMEVVVC